PRSGADGKRSRWAILGLGKLGGRELNYHSDLDLIFLRESEGETSGGPESISNDEFVTEVVRRTLRFLGGGSSTSPLYSIDARLRPYGASGPLVVTLDEFRRYFESQAQSWERLALTRSRVIFANGIFGRSVSEAILDILAVSVEPESLAREVVAMRRRLEDTGARNDLKRGWGEIADIEFVVQYLQLVHALNHPEVIRSNLWETLDALRRAGLLAPEACTDLREAYEFLRTVESRLRLVQNRSVSDLPENP
ncbi:[protein-PII] uridylyltransferase family protein, partial [Singulisphaera rosea]